MSRLGGVLPALHGLFMWALMVAGVVFGTLGYTVAMVIAWGVGLLLLSLFGLRYAWTIIYNGLYVLAGTDSVPEEEGRKS